MVNSNDIIKVKQNNKILKKLLDLKSVISNFSFASYWNVDFWRGMDFFLNIKKILICIKI